MQKYNISHIGTSEWFNYKQEIIFGLFHALRSLGKDVVISHNNLDPNRINIIIGADWLVQDKGFNDFIDGKIKYIIFEVEAFDGSTINNRSEFNVNNYRRLIENAISVITPYQYNLDTLKKIIHPDRVQYLKWGFFEELIDPNIVRDQPRNYRGAFFGLLKGERLDKARSLQTVFGGKIAFLGREHPHLYRASILSNSEYAISLSYGITEKFVNPFRLYYLYANGIQVLSDNKVDTDGYLCLSISVDNSQLAEFLMLQPQGEHELKQNARLNHLKSNIKTISL